MRTAEDGTPRPAVRPAGELAGVRLEEPPGSFGPALPEPERRPCDVATLVDEILVLPGPELGLKGGLHGTRDLLSAAG